MIRVIYRWAAVAAGQEQAFIDAWEAITLATRASVKGARGSMLLRNPQNPAEFVAVARWASVEDWQASRAAGPRVAEAARVMKAAAPPPSIEVLEELLDLTLADG